MVDEKREAIYKCWCRLSLVTNLYIFLKSLLWCFTHTVCPGHSPDGRKRWRHGQTMDRNNHL